MLAADPVAAPLDLEIEAVGRRPSVVPPQPGLVSQPDPIEVGATVSQDGIVEVDTPDRRDRARVEDGAAGLEQLSSQGRDVVTGEDELQLAARVEIGTWRAVVEACDGQVAGPCPREASRR